MFIYEASNWVRERWSLKKLVDIWDWISSIYCTTFYDLSKKFNGLSLKLFHFLLSPTTTATTTDNCIKWYHRKKNVFKFIPFKVLTHIALSRCRCFCITSLLPAHIEALKKIRKWLYTTQQWYNIIVSLTRSFNAI